MNNLIDYTYFKGKLSIPNIAETGSVQNRITALITDSQYEFLNKILGPSLYTQFAAWYAVMPLDQTSYFYGLLKGMVFSSDGKYCDWIGLQNDKKLSPLANFVYYCYQEEESTNSVSGGEAKTKSQNAVSASPVFKMVNAWNEMADYLKGFITYMNFFYGTSGQVDYYTNPLGYRAPVTLQAGITTGFGANQTSFTFEGTAGAPNFKGYEIYPERIGQGTLVDNVGYTWDPQTAVFTLTDGTQPNEYFNFTFSPSGLITANLEYNSDWTNYSCHRNKIFEYRNSLGL